MTGSSRGFLRLGGIEILRVVPAVGIACSCGPPKLGASLRFIGLGATECEHPVGEGLEGS